METNIEIYPLKLFKRTEYSKIRLIDMLLEKDITDENVLLIEELLNIYNDQTSRPEECFEMTDSAIHGTLFPLRNAKYIFIPENIEAIKDEAFQKGNLSFISIPNTIKTIGDYVFKNSRIEAIKIPDNIEEIGFGLFENCTSLRTVKLPAALKIIRGTAFSCCHLLNNVIIPEGTESLSSHSFFGCASLTNISLPKSLMSLDSYAFACCTSLEHIVLPDNLKIMMENCFMGCSMLKEIDIPDGVTSLRDRIFSGCTNLERVKLPNNLRSLDAEVFAGCNKLKDLMLPDTISSMGRLIFANTYDLENINIPRALNYVTSHPFSTSKIKSLTFNHSLKKLRILEGDLVSNSCINKIIVDKNCKIIAPNAFKYSGEQITELAYTGTKKQFENFKENNKDLFVNLKGLERINFLGEKNKDKEMTVDDLKDRG